MVLYVERNEKEEGEGDMTEVELISYKICSLKLENNLNNDCKLKLIKSVSSDCDWNDGMAVMTLQTTLQQFDNPKRFCIEIKLEGRLWVSRVKSITDKKEIHATGYRKLLVYANAILSMLAVHSGLEDLDVGRTTLEAEDIHFGPQPDNVKEGKIVKLCPNE